MLKKLFGSVLKMALEKFNEKANEELEELYSLVIDIENNIFMVNGSELDFDTMILRTNGIWSLTTTEKAYSMTIK